MSDNECFGKRKNNHFKQMFSKWNMEVKLVLLFIKIWHTEERKDTHTLVVLQLTTSWQLKSKCWARPALPHYVHGMLEQGGDKLGVEEVSQPVRHLGSTRLETCTVHTASWECGPCDRTWKVSLYLLYMHNLPFLNLKKRGQPSSIPSFLLVLFLFVNKRENLTLGFLLTLFQREKDLKSKF